MGVSVKTVEAWEREINHPAGPSSRLIGMLEKQRDFTLELTQASKIYNVSIIRWREPLFVAKSSKKSSQKIHK